MSTKQNFGEKTGAYFVSFATVNGIDVFTIDAYFGDSIESLDFCRKHKKGMKIYGYCITSSHVHLIFRSESGNPSGLMRDFKGFTSKKCLKKLKKTYGTAEGKPNEVVRHSQWMLWIMDR